MLASDVANPEFVNPKNPDSLLSVEFVMMNPVDGWATNEKSVAEGRQVIVRKHKEEEPYVKISSPGQRNLTEIVEKVREDHKRRFPQQWLYFQMQQGMVDEDVEGRGWRVEDWDYLDADRVKELKHLRFHTVEQIAGASDIQVQGMGMMGPGLRIEARKALQARVDNQIKEVNDAMQKENEALKDKVKGLGDQMEELKQMIQAQTPKGRK